MPSKNILKASGWYISITWKKWQPSIRKYRYSYYLLGENLKCCLYLAYGDEVTKRFRHFLTIYIDKTIVYPVIDATVATCRTALCYLILMVWKDEVFPTTMYVKRMTQIMCTHGTAFDVPTWPSRAPRALPPWLPIFCSLELTWNEFMIY